jgi:hypothetical protein
MFTLEKNDLKIFPIELVIAVENQVHQNYKIRLRALRKVELTLFKEGKKASAK